MMLWTRSGGRLRVAAIGTVAAALAVVAPTAGAPPELKQKQAEAQRILGEVNSLDVQLGRTVEAWDGARYELGKLRVQERRNAKQLAVARHQFAVAQRRAQQRLVELYESNEPTTADAVLGAATVSDILNRVELVDAASALDHRIAEAVATTRDRLERKAAELEADRKRQTATVSFLASRRQAIQAGLSRRRALLASVQGEVQRLLAKQRAEQARLAAQARARVLAEQRRLAAERARAARAAKAAAAKRAAEQAAVRTTKPKLPSKPTGTTTTTTTTSSTTTPSAPATTTTTTTTDPLPPPPPLIIPANTGAGHPEAATIALRYLGIPYQWGGASPETGFDCSGLVMYVYAQLGISLPHFAAAQYGYGTPVPRNGLQPGDLVFFDKLNHVGISLGGDQFVEAPHTGDVVKISTITGWYASTYVGARRI